MTKVLRFPCYFARIIVSNPPPPAIESINPASMATKKRTPSNSGETINRLLNVSIRSRAHPVAPGRKAATEAVSSSQALLFPVLEVQTSFAVLPRNHRLVAVKVDLHTPDYRQGNVIVHAYARDAGTRVALCATSRDRCPHQGKVVV